MNTQSARYYNPIPIGNPDFIYRRYSQAIVDDTKRMIEWSKKEYNDALRMFAKRGQFDTVRSLSQNYSPMRLLAEAHGFKKMIAFLVQDTEAFNRLSWRDRIFVRRAWEIHEMLRKS